MKYRPDLDGIRAFAVLAVLASHTEVTAALGGWMGVDIFFVLSGYLITALLLTEMQRTGRIALGQFYIRRALRLYPALLTMLLLGAFFYGTLGDGGTLLGYGRSAFYVGTYIEDLIFGLTQNSHGGFDHTWSLAVEEQFYLLWPPALVLILRFKRDPLKWAAGFTIVSWTLMILQLHSSPASLGNLPFASYFLPWNRFSQLTVGCCLAVLISRGISPRLVRYPTFGLATAVGCIAMIGLAAKFPRYPHLSWEAPAIAIVAAAMIWHLDSGMTALRRLLGWGPFAYIGRRSYGIYIYHWPILQILATYVHVRRIERSAIMVVLAFAVAIVSYRFIELPFLRLKGRFASPPGRHTRARIVSNAH